MGLLASVELLAQLPETFTFISWWKLLLVTLVFVGWAYLAQWIDKDTQIVNTYRDIWNLTTMGAGVAATAVMLLAPFVIGFPTFVVLVGAAAGAYVMHRNGMVRDEDKVLTGAHIKSLFAGDGKKKEKEVREKVAIRGADRKRVKIPEDPDQRERYRLTQELLFDIRWRRAQRAELAPGREAASLVYEVDGVRTEQEPWTSDEAEHVVQFLKVIAALDLEERRKPQTGKISVAMGEESVTVEVRTDGSTQGEKLTLRVIGEETRYKIEDLGFTAPQTEQMRAAMLAGEPGLVVVGAPPGGGMTTTLYSLTRTHDAFLNNIQTLEYRIELPIDNVTQIEYVPADNKTFAGELQKLLRTDPDIIILPEIREPAAAILATEAAGKKQFVYAGLQEPTLTESLAVLRKWMELVNDNAKVAKALSAVTSQRLIRKLCPSCKQAYKPNPEQLKRLNMPADAVLYRQPEPEFDKKGNPIICQNCQGSGYVGRTAIFDLLLIDDDFRHVVRNARAFADVQQYAVKRGGFGFQTHALRKVLEGVTSIQEVQRVLSGKNTDKSKSSSGGKPGAGGKAAPRKAAPGKPKPAAVAKPKSTPKKQAG